MLLYLVRHALAAPAETSQDDAARPLTDDGVRKFSAEVLGAQGLGWRLDRVYHSPLVRAAQTAELLRPLLTGPMRSLADLAREPDEDLLTHIDGERVALVGHEPYLGALLAWLTTGARHLGAHFPLKKGGVAVLEGPLRPGEMALRALVPPKLLRVTGA